MSHRDCLVMPHTWLRLRPVLEACLDLSNMEVQSCLQDITLRNSFLCCIMKANMPEPTSPQRQVIAILDAASLPYELDALTQACVSIMLDHDKFIEYLCEWAVTPLRVGLYRVYLASAILRQQARAGVSVQEPIMRFLEKYSAVPASKQNVYLLVSELVRAAKFSVTSYMRWLIATGVLGSYTALEKVSLIAMLLVDVTYHI